MKKSILIIGNYPPPYGGIPVHLEYLAPYLASRGWDVHVLPIKPRSIPVEHIGNITLHSQYLDGTNLSNELHELYIKNFWERKQRELLVKQDRSLIKASMYLAKRAEEIIREYDIRAISAYHIFPAGLTGAWLAREFGIPLVTSIFGEIYSEFALHRRRRREVKFVLGNSKSLVSCSAHCAKSPKKLGLNVKVDVAHYGIDTTVFLPNIDATDIRRRLNLVNEDKVVIFVGRMTREMGLQILMESIPKVLEVMPNIRFVIAGRSAELLEPARDLRNKFIRNVFVIPDVPREELPQCYALSTISVVPSINDRACLGLAAAEALACGKPVIITNIGGGPEVVTEECGRLIPPEDPSALACSIMSLINDAESIKQMGQAGRSRAVAYFDKEQINQQMELIFDQVLEAASRNDKKS